MNVFVKFMQKFMQKTDDSLNPIVVKELRQAVRGRQLVILIMLYLIILLLSMGWYTMTDLSGNINNLSQISQMGKKAFEVLFSIVLFSSLIFVPAYTAIRTIKEKTLQGVEMIFFSTLKPGRIIRGKLYAGMVITMILFSASMPFVSFTYFLRGIDIPTIIIIMLMGFCGVTFAIQLSLVAACVSCNKVIRSLLSLASSGIILSLCIFIIAQADTMHRSGIGSTVFTAGFWYNFASIFLLFLLITGFAHSLSVAAISPVSFNRSFVIRCFATVIWIAGAVIPWINLDFDFLSGSDFIEMWFGFSFLVLSLWLPAAASERDEYGLRIRSQIPKKLLKKIPAFFLFTGSVNGILWILLIGFLTFAGAWGGQFYAMHVSSKIIRIFSGFFLYSWCYSLTGFFIQRRLLNKKIPRQYTWALILLIFIFIQILPLFSMLASGMGDIGNNTFLGNIFVFAAESKSKQMAHINFCLIWAVIATISNTGLFLRQIKSFVPASNYNIAS